MTITGNNTSISTHRHTAVANPIVFGNSVTSFTFGNYGSATTVLPGVVTWGSVQDIAITAAAVGGSAISNMELIRRDLRLGRDHEGGAELYVPGRQPMPRR